MACFAPEAIGSRAGAHISLHPQEADGRAPFKTKFARCSLKDTMATAVLALVAWTTVSQAQTVNGAAPTAPVPQQQSAPPEGAAPAGDGLSEP